ncbi:MAG: TRAP transporter small permease [Burkholderiaceae bacterium]
MIITLERAARRLSNWLAMMGLLGLLALALMTIASVLSRWLLSHPMEWVEDIYRLLIAVVVASFFPSAFAHRGHIAIEFLSMVLPARGRRAVAVLAAIVTFVFTIVLGWQLVLYTREVWETGETTWLLGYSVTPWWALVTALLLMTVPAQLIVTLADLYHGPRPGDHGPPGHGSAPDTAGQHELT